MSSHGDINHVGDGRLGDSGSTTSCDAITRSCELALKTCDAMEKDDTSGLYNVLNLSMTKSYAKEGVVEDKAAHDGADSTSINTGSRCNQLLLVFYSLIGHPCDDTDFKGTIIRRTDIPLAVKAHLLLKALLRMPSDRRSISWKSAKATIQTLQFTINNQTEKSSLSHGEEVAMVAEIRAFITRIQIEKILKREVLNQAIEHLMELGNTILDPFLINNTKLGASAWKRRQNSYLLPLELIPTILAALDVLDDKQTNIAHVFSIEDHPRGHKAEDDEAANGDADIMAEQSPERQAKHAQDVRPSETLLSSMFATYSRGDTSDCSTKASFQRAMRADALLHMLSLAMDDVGSSQVAMSLSSNEGLTYWDCLKFALNETIQTNLICYDYGDESNNRMVGEEAKQQIIDDAISDQGLHIIPLSDYPGLMRCVFRMVTTTSHSHDSSWEGILLRLYRATAVATSKTPLASAQRHKHSGEPERLTMLSTVESHVLLPSFTGASVSTIKSVLEACIRECCSSCNQNTKQVQGNNVLHSCEANVVPTWAAAGLALLIMRARASSISHSMAPVTFGPREVFRMASQVLCKSQTKDIQRLGDGDEVGCATKVLLYLACIESDICHACRDDNPSHSPGNAYDVLKSTYYGGNEQFLPRYNPRKSHRHQLGLQTLSSYSHLVRASLNHGTLHGTEKMQLDSFAVDTAGTWINVANTLLDESETSNDVDGAAMAIVIILVIFFEVPSSRDDIVRSIYDRLVNMASRCGGKAGRQNEEACFVLISTLAWSLVAGCEKLFNVDVVHPKGAKSNTSFASSMLGPLCNLLSKSATPSYQDVHGALPSSGSPHLSHWALHRLAHALAPVPAGRDALLAIAQKNLRVLSISSTYSTSRAFTCGESIPSTPAAANDAVFLAVYCLCVLIQKCHPSNSSADDCSQTALGMLTDLIVLQCPSVSYSSNTSSRVSLDVISWMLGELNKSARLEKLAVWASQRLLRACVVGLMRLMSFTKTETGEDISPILLPGKIFSVTYSSPRIAINQRHDIPGMLRLAFSLYASIARSNGSIETELVESVPELHTLLVPHLVQTVRSRPGLTLEKDNDNDTVNELLQFARDILQRGFNPSDESMSVFIDGVLLIILAQGATRLIRNDRMCSLKSVGSDDALTKLIVYICDAEKHVYLRQSNVNKQQHDPMTLPSWIEVQHTSLTGKTGGQVMDGTIHIDALLSSDQFALLHMSLCDILGEILLCGGPSQDLSVLLSIDCLFGTKLQMKEAIAGSSSMLLLENLSQNSLSNILGLSSLHLRSLLSPSEGTNNKSALAEVSCMLRNILDACKVIQSNRFSHEVSDLSEVLSSFWALYCALADDESSQILTSFIKESYVEIGGWAEEGSYDISDTSYSLLSITSSEDLDYHVRHLRGVFLETLTQILTIIPPSQACLSLEDRRASLGILFQLLPHICQDLDAGFLGSSGGLSKRLVLGFLNSVAKCIDTMASLFDLLPSAVQRDIGGSFVSVHQAAAIVWGIFRDNSLQQASIVRGALRLCVDKMPRLICKIERVANAPLIKNEPPHSYTCELLNHCSAGLLSFQVNNDGDMTKMTTASDSSSNTTQIQLQQNEIPLVQATVTTSEENDNAQREESGGECKVKSKGLKTNSMTADTLPWMYNCAFAAVTNKMNDSYRIISGNPKSNRRRGHCIKEEMPTSLSLQRINDISSLHTSVCQMFQATRVVEDEKRDAELDSEQSTLLSEFLSYYGKSSICSCVEKMVITLTSSIKQITKQIKLSQNNTPCSTFDDDKLHESMICLLGWLSSVKTKQTDHSIVTGPLQWYMNEKKNFNLPSGGGLNTEGYPILSRLPKVILRLEGLEAELRKLDFFLAGFSSDDNAVYGKMVSLLDAMTFIGVTDNETNKLERENAFRVLLRDCLGILDTSKNEVKATGADIISGEDTSDEDLEESEVVSGWKRQKQRYTPIRKSRRVNLRSRNETIDNWLTMDNDEFGPEPGEKYNADDAFVDLEDFIVEG